MNDEYISVIHGKMTLKVPRDMFKGPDAELVEDKVEEFKRVTQSRYPWIRDTGMEVILRNARKEMLRVMDEESGGRSTSKRYASKGQYELAISHLKKRLEEYPEDADSWYALGELLCKAGKVEEGYRAINKGRSLKK